MIGHNFEIPGSTPPDECLCLQLQRRGKMIKTKENSCLNLLKEKVTRQRILKSHTANSAHIAFVSAFLGFCKIIVVIST